MLVVLDRRRPKLNGLYPVKVEVVSNRKQKYYPAGIDLSPEEWTEIWDLRRKSEERNRLEEAFFRVAREIDSLVRGERFSFRALDQRMGLRRSGVPGQYRAGERSRRPGDGLCRFMGERAGVARRNLTASFFHDCFTFHPGRLYYSGNAVNLIGKVA